jgi:hypothetical protein
MFNANKEKEEIQKEIAGTLRKGTKRILERR